MNNRMSLGIICIATLVVLFLPAGTSGSKQPSIDRNWDTDETTYGHRVFVPVIGYNIESNPPPAPHFTLVEHRLLTVEENGGSVDNGHLTCGLRHELSAAVLDASGQPLNGVTVKMVYGGQEEGVSGTYGPGLVKFTLWPPGNEARVARDVGNLEATSDRAAAPQDTRLISYAHLIAAHYCQNDSDCAAFVAANGCYGHYSWKATFQRDR